MANGFVCDTTGVIAAFFAHGPRHGRLSMRRMGRFQLCLSHRSNGGSVVLLGDPRTAHQGSESSRDRGLPAVGNRFDV